MLINLNYILIYLTYNWVSSLYHDNNIRKENKICSCIINVNR
jgi:hypothetical protein